MSEAVDLKELQGHSNILNYFAQSISLGRLCSTYIFTGPTGIGKFLCALHCARLSLCESLVESNACGTCDHCLSFKDLETNPQVSIVSFTPKKSDESAVDRVRQFIQDVEKSTSFNRIIYIIKNLESYSIQVQNALLKTFEEPPEKAVFILCSDRAHLLLDTIHSRAQVLNLSSLDKQSMKKVLSNLEIDRLKHELLIEMSSGSVDTALKLNKESFQLLLSWTEKFMIGQNTDFLKKSEEAIELAKSLEMEIESKNEDRERLGVLFKFFERIFLGKLLDKCRDHFVAWQVYLTLVEELTETRYSIERSGHIALSVEHYFQIAINRLNQINRFLKMKEI